MYIERLHGGERYDATARNRIGTLGAFVSLWPAQSEVDAAVARARGILERGERVDGVRVSRVAPEVSP